MDYKKRIYTPLLQELSNGEQLAQSGVTFGSLFTAEAMIALELAPPGSSASSRFSKAAWLPQARLDARRALPMAQELSGVGENGGCGDLFWLDCVATGRRPKARVKQGV